MSMHFDEKPPTLHFIGGLAWLAAALIVVLVAIALVLRMGRIADGEVGVLQNRWTGTATVVPATREKLYLSLIHRFEVLDCTQQTLEMTADAAAGQGEVTVRTADGSDVQVEVVVQYRIAPDQAAVVLRDAGPGDAFKQGWVGDCVRALVQARLGELTAEECHDASLRSQRIEAATVAANDALAPHGIQVESIVLPTRPRFGADAEAMARKRAAAAQRIQQEEAKIETARQRQVIDEAAAASKQKLALVQAKGAIERQLIQAEAECARIRREAEAYSDRTTAGAEAVLYQKSCEAKAILVKKQAEAEGLAALSKALAGDGGLNLVKLEYARRLKGAVVTVQPEVASPAAAQGGK